MTATTANAGWTKEDSAAAEADGWDVFHVDEQYYDIQKSDYAEQFGEDVAAIAHVYYMASAGSPLHRKALHFVLQPGNVCPLPAVSLKVHRRSSPTNGA